MTASAFILTLPQRVKPMKVIFGGLECEAIEFITGGGVAAGLHVRVPAPNTQWVATDDLVWLASNGRLSCRWCGRYFEFPAMGQVYSFPFSPLPGWFVSDPGVLSGTLGDGQEINPRVRCDACSKWLANYVGKAFVEELAR